MRRGPNFRVALLCDDFTPTLHARFARPPGVYRKRSDETYRRSARPRLIDVFTVDDGYYHGDGARRATGPRAPSCYTVPTENGDPKAPFRSRRTDAAEGRSLLGLVSETFRAGRAPFVAITRRLYTRPFRRRRHAETSGRIIRIRRFRRGVRRFACAASRQTTLSFSSRKDSGRVTTAIREREGLCAFARPSFLAEYFRSREKHESHDQPDSPARLSAGSVSPRRCATEKSNDSLDRTDSAGNARLGRLCRNRIRRRRRAFCISAGAAAGVLRRDLGTIPGRKK